MTRYCEGPCWRRAVVVVRWSRWERHMCDACAARLRAGLSVESTQEEIPGARPIVEPDVEDRYPSRHREVSARAQREHAALIEAVEIVRASGRRMPRHLIEEIVDALGHLPDVHAATIAGVGMSVWCRWCAMAREVAS